MEVKNLKNNQEKSKLFDQFYTQDKIAIDCLEKIFNVLKTNFKTLDFKKMTFLEPSAGGGAFLRALKNKGYNNFFAIDIDPGYKDVKKLDFLQDNLSSFLPKRDQIITIGNPPFGHRAKLAIDFINKSLEYSNIVAFILPLQFEKYSAQKNLNPNAKLIYDEKLPDESFVYQDKPYKVRCCLQIWTTLETDVDLRLRSSPITKHVDFDMWQYNNTREAEKYFDKNYYKWDFAVPRQGYKDYTIKETDPDKMDHRTQWIFFRAKTPEVRARLEQIDFVKLSKKNISIPGFGKADVIEEYNRLFSASALEKSLAYENSVLAGLPLALNYS